MDTETFGCTVSEQGFPDEFIRTSQGRIVQALRPFGGRVVLVLGLLKNQPSQFILTLEPLVYTISSAPTSALQRRVRNQAPAPPSHACTCPSWNPRLRAPGARLLSRSEARLRARLHPRRRAACPPLPRRRGQRPTHPPDRKPLAEALAGKPCLKPRGPTAVRQGHTSACACFRLEEVPPSEGGLGRQLPVASIWQA